MPLDAALRPTRAAVEGLAGTIAECTYLLHARDATTCQDSMTPTRAHGSLELVS